MTFIDRSKAAHREPGSLQRERLDGEGLQRVGLANEQLVVRDDRGAVRILTMNRPEARNALSLTLISALHTALTDADHDESVRAVVLTGADPAFCAGLDLKQAHREGPAYFERLHRENCIIRVAQMSKPVLGAINGAAITGGMEMALGCDFLVASNPAVFADTHARVGILPGAGMTARLPHAVGVGMARRLSMTSEVIDAARAQTMGLVTEVVDHARPLDRTVELARQVAEVAAPIMQGLKAIYVTGAAAVLDPALAAEQAIGAAGRRHAADLTERYREVAERNRRQIRRGGRPRKVDVAEAAKARQLKDKGVTATDIAKMLGVSRAIVYRYRADDAAA